VRRARTALCGLLAWLAASTGAGAEPESEFSVLTYNTHGLSAWIAGDDPERRFPLLLERSNAYDVVLLQEDFAYHELVRKHASHPLVVRGNGPAWSWLGFSGSGLTVLARTPSPRIQRARAYGHCHGWLSAANDCFANKGYLMLRLRVADGVEIDVWNTHLDAGIENGDHAARTVQLDLLAADIARESRGRALVVGGDFNTDWADPRDRALLESFVGRIGASIAVNASHQRWPQRLDYLLMRSGTRIALDLVAGGIAEEFIDSEGVSLSDHPALWGRFRVSAR